MASFSASLFSATLVILATAALAAPFEPPTAENTTSPAPSVNETTLPSTTTTTTMNLPAFPALVNSFLLQPLINFNNRVSQAADSMPDQFSNSGKSLGSALVVPIQFGTNFSNNLLTGFNSTVLSVSSVIHPIIISPLSWMVNTTMGNMTLNAFNFSVTQLGTGINSLGSSVSSAGDRLQNKGHTLIDWVKALDEAMRQLNSSISLSNTTVTTPIDILNETTAASSSSSITTTTTTTTTTTLQSTEVSNAIENFTTGVSPLQA